MSAFVDNDSFRDLIQKWPGAFLHYLRKRYYHKLVHISTQKTHNREASEDIVQEALIEVWKKSEWLAKQDGLLIGPYLLSIVKFKSITFYHKAASRKEESHPPEVLDEFTSTILPMESQIIKSDLYQRLRDLVFALPDREKSCIELKYFDGLSNDAIARELSISKRTVEKYLTRGIKHLRAHKVLIR